MSNTLFAAFAVLAPVHGFLRKFAAGTGGMPRLNPPPAGHAREALVNAVVVPVNCARARSASRTGNRANTPLRVVRVMEAGQSSAYGGRMMISGRMADVCAELDRMAEREA